MSTEDDKVKHSERIQQKTKKVTRKVKIAKAFGFTEVTKNPHKYAKKSMFGCGNKNCIMCMNPRKAWGEKTMQEQKFEQREHMKCVEDKDEV
jgi:hypothetical protein